MTYFLKSQSMKKLLCNLPRFVLWIAFLLIIESYVTLQAQTSSSNNSSKAISGKIVDETDLPIAGATVQVKGSTKGGHFGYRWLIYYFIRTRLYFDFLIFRIPIY